MYYLLAEGGNAMETLVTALQTGFTGIASDGVDALAKITPTALPILGAMMTVGVGIKAYKRVSGTR